MTMDDATFLAAFEAGERPGGEFRHVDHLRLVWILLRRDGAALGEERVAAAIRRFAASQGTPELYHETLTRAWTRLVAAAFAASPRTESFAQLLAAHPELADKTHVFRFYSAEALSKPRARWDWIEPDLAPFPRQLGVDDGEDRRALLLRRAFLVGAVTDALALIPMLVPSMASLLWGFDDASGPYRFAMGYAASLMLAWTGVLFWARRRPIERDFVAPLTVLVIYGLVATEIVAVVSGHMAAWRILPTWILQAGLIALFAGAYHFPALSRWRPSAAISQV